jgi:hypothetical protein
MGGGFTVITKKGLPREAGGGSPFLTVRQALTLTICVLVNQQWFIFVVNIDVRTAQSSYSGERPQFAFDRRFPLFPRRLGIYFACPVNHLLRYFSHSH